MSVENEPILVSKYEINACIEWIEANHFSSICLQFSRQSLPDSSTLALILQKRTRSQYYITVSSMCCVDFTTIKHLSDTTIDAIIYFGGVCLDIVNNNNYPVFQVFGNNYDSDCLNFIESTINDHKSDNIVILYDTSYTTLALNLIELNKYNDQNRNISFAKLRLISDKRFCSPNTMSAVIDSELAIHTIGPYVTPEPIDSYDLVVYIGKCNSLNLILECKQLLEIDVENKRKTLIDCDKELRKRIAKIEKFKQESCSRVGIILSNPLPDVENVFCESKRFAKKLKKKVYFVSLVQTLDEYKLGNFSQLNAFVVVTGCWCSTLLDSLRYHVPILSWTEFEIASGLQRKYGPVVWNQHLEISDDDQQSDDHSDICELTSNLIIEANIFKKDNWFGLEVDSGSKEPSLVKDGQTGIASGYQNEGQDYY